MSQFVRGSSLSSGMLQEKKKKQLCSSANINLGHETAIKTAFCEEWYEWFTLVPLTVSLTTDGHQSVGWRWSIVHPVDRAHPHYFNLCWTSLQPAAEQSLHQLTTHSRDWMGLCVCVHTRKKIIYLKPGSASFTDTTFIPEHITPTWKSRHKHKLSLIVLSQKGSHIGGIPPHSIISLSSVHQSPKVEMSALFWWSHCVTNKKRRK